MNSSRPAREGHITPMRVHHPKDKQGNPCFRLDNQEWLDFVGDCLIDCRRMVGAKRRAVGSAEEYLHDAIVEIGILSDGKFHNLSKELLKEEVIKVARQMIGRASYVPRIKMGNKRVSAHVGHENLHDQVAQMDLKDASENLAEMQHYRQKLNMLIGKLEEYGLSKEHLVILRQIIETGKSETLVEQFSNDKRIKKQGQFRIDPKELAHNLGTHKRTAERFIEKINDAISNFEGFREFNNLELEKEEGVDQQLTSPIGERNEREI